MDYSNYLILYSGGADSTYFIEKQKTARHLIYFKGLNEHKTKVAVTNATILGRYLTIQEIAGVPGLPLDGETNVIHALYDTQMALQASIVAVSHGMKGIVMCFNADDLGIDADAIVKIMRKVEPDFELLLPLKRLKASKIRTELKKSNLTTVSCMNDMHCGFCAKCIREY
jgi:7-cyano-7-deazaguanine synthase in queuosine biosynthesis